LVKIGILRGGCECRFYLLVDGVISGVSAA
jgi:hypothetical protein